MQGAADLLLEGSFSAWLLIAAGVLLVKAGNACSYDCSVGAWLCKDFAKEGKWGAYRDWAMQALGQLQLLPQNVLLVLL